MITRNLAFFSPTLSAGLPDKARPLVESMAFIIVSK